MGVLLWTIFSWCQRRWICLLGCSSVSLRGSVVRGDVERRSAEVSAKERMRLDRHGEGCAWARAILWGGRIWLFSRGDRRRGATSSTASRPRYSLRTSRRIAGYRQILGRRNHLLQRGHLEQLAPWDEQAGQDRRRDPWAPRASGCHLGDRDCLACILRWREPTIGYDWSIDRLSLPMSPRRSFSRRCETARR